MKVNLSLDQKDWSAVWVSLGYVEGVLLGLSHSSDSLEEDKEVVGQAIGRLQTVAGILGGSLVLQKEPKK